MNDERPDDVPDGDAHRTVTPDWARADAEECRRRKAAEELVQLQARLRARLSNEPPASD